MSAIEGFVYVITTLIAAVLLYKLSKLYKTK